MRCIKCNAEINEGMVTCPGCSLPLTPEIFKKNVGYPVRTGWISFFAILNWIGFGTSSLSAAVLIISGKTWVENVEWFIIAAFVEAVLFFWCAYGLWNLKNYGRKIYLIFAYIQLIAIPIGTVVGILIIRYFRKPEIKALFSEKKFKILSKEQIMKLALKIEKSPKLGTIVLLTISIYLALALLLVAFSLFWGPGGFLKKKTSPYVVSVGRDKITVVEYERQLLKTLQHYQEQFQNNFNKSMITRLRIPEQILQNMIHMSIIQTEARKLNITVSDEELKEKIINLPAFQRDGKFIGVENYKRILASNRMDINEFEDQLKKQIIGEKLQEFVTRELVIDDDTLQDKYKKERDKADLDFIIFRPVRIKKDINVEDKELTDYYEKNKEVAAKKVELLREEAANISTKLNRMTDEKKIEAFLKKEDLSPTAVTYKRGNRLSRFPVRTGLDDLVFSMQENRFSYPMAFNDQVVIFKVKSKTITNTANFEKEKAHFYTQEITRLKNSFFWSYIDNKKSTYKIATNQELFEQIKEWVMTRFN